ncbi:MAG: hypothetical protein KIT60_03480 [Burkholderiaceae bacterium]|nr:hypothetical protein [Burkholderiaceae bacterium]
MTMDDTPVPNRAPGGSVEPVTRAAITKAAARTLDEHISARFELRDPFAEVTYRTKTFDEMVLKADQLGAVRFNAIDDEGRRTPVLKVGNVWQRPDPAQNRTAPAESARPAPAQPEAALARIDAEAERAAALARLQNALNERYVIKRALATIGDKPIGHNEYRYRGDTSRVAFTESAFKLSTDTNSPSVARSMVDVAQARQWHALRVSGHDDFRRMVWLEASVRGVRTVGYEPVPGDEELLRKEREARQVNRIESTGAPPSTAHKACARGSGSRKTVLAALEAVLVGQRVPAQRRDAIMAAAAANLSKRLAAGEVHRIKVYDRTAPSPSKSTPTRAEPERARERTPAR